MTSKELGWLGQMLDELKADLIVTGKDYDKYSRQEHRMALSFRLLASAAVEQYVEDRCKAAARHGLNRLPKGQPTRTGHSLTLWYLIKRDKGVIPLNAAEVPKAADFLNAVHAAYENTVNKTHGMDDKDLRALVIPLGLPETDIDGVLCAMLKDLSNERNKAAHRLINRAKSMTEPIEEWNKIQAILYLLKDLDAALDRAATNS
ncbi:hypothetical protein Sru01_40760 [Sphaerisporangium rufum]|uniref:RiboL-PSP-HEPN domain-containing protein n=1 Tax=Sphaerisporangium rufum TaxID=1381558 RepID=A0A919V0U8_9ACTN|nr:hypothetical protein [Sphaerisporangium rufum]GII79094.1 hypothetical protein Sru01_40760 [Sphaerisporangium rufum]